MVKKYRFIRFSLTALSIVCLLGSVLGTLKSFLSSVGSPKTLVIVVGNLRGGDQLWRSMQRNLLHPLNADLAVFSPPHVRSVLDDISKYLWELPDPENLEEEFDRINPSKTWRELCAMQLHVFMGVRCGPSEGKMGTAGLQFYSREKLRQKILSTGVLALYDWFIITRSDYFYLCPFTERNFNSAYIYTPATQEYRGINDRFAVVHRSKIIDFLNVTRELLNAHPSSLAAELNELGAQGNPESMLKLHLKHMRTTGQVIQHSGFTLRRSCDNTTWSQGEEGPYGYYIKYREELEFAETVCNIRWAESPQLNLQRMESCE